MQQSKDTVLSRATDSMGGKRDLKRSIEEFQRALSIWPLDQPCHVAAKTNLAIAKFIPRQIEDKPVSQCT